MADIRPIGNVYDLWKATDKRMAESGKRIARFEVGKLYYGDDEHGNHVIFRCNGRTGSIVVLQIVKVSNGTAIPSGKTYKGKITVYKGYDWKSEYFHPDPKILIPSDGFSIVFGITAIHKVSDVKYPLVKKIKVIPAPFGL